MLFALSFYNYCKVTPSSKSILSHTMKILHLTTHYFLACWVYFIIIFFFFDCYSSFDMLTFFVCYCCCCCWNVHFDVEMLGRCCCCCWYLWCAVAMVHCDVHPSVSGVCMCVCEFLCWLCVSESFLLIWQLHTIAKLVHKIPMPVCVFIHWLHSGTLGVNGIFALTSARDS